MAKFARAEEFTLGCEQRALGESNRFLVFSSDIRSPKPAFVVNHRKVPLAFGMELEAWETDPRLDPPKKPTKDMLVRTSDWYQSQVLPAVEAAAKKYNRHGATEHNIAKLFTAAEKYLAYASYFIIRKLGKIVGTVRLIKSPYVLDAKTGLPIVGRLYMPLMMESPEFLNMELPKFFDPELANAQGLFEGLNIEVGVYFKDDELPWLEQLEIHAALMGELYRDGKSDGRFSVDSYHRHYFTYGTRLTRALYTPLGFRNLWTYALNGVWRYPTLREEPEPIFFEDKNWWPLYLPIGNFEQWQTKKEEAAVEDALHNAPYLRRYSGFTEKPELVKDYRVFIRDTFDRLNVEGLDWAKERLEELRLELNEKRFVHADVIGNPLSMAEAVEEAFANIIKVGEITHALELKLMNYTNHHRNERITADLYCYVQTRFFGQQIQQKTADGWPFIYIGGTLESFFTPVWSLVQLLTENQPKKIYAIGRILRMLYASPFYLSILREQGPIKWSQDDRQSLGLEGPNRGDFEPERNREIIEIHYQGLAYEGLSPVDQALGMSLLRQIIQQRRDDLIPDFQAFCQRYSQGLFAVLETMLIVIKHEDERSRYPELPPPHMPKADFPSRKARRSALAQP